MKRTLVDDVHESASTALRSYKSASQLYTTLFPSEQAQKGQGHRRSCPTALLGQMGRWPSTLYKADHQVIRTWSHQAEDELRSLFQGSGEIAYVKMPPEKGRGFLQFEDPQAA